MRRLLYALAIVLTSAAPAWAQGTIVGPGNMVLCPLSAQAAIVTATTTQLVAPSGSTRVYICGWHVTSTQSTSTTFQFEYGSGATCGTNTQVFTPAFSVTSTAPSADHQSFAIGPSSATGVGLCVITTGTTVGQAVMIYYSQF